MSDRALLAAAALAIEAGPARRPGVEPRWEAADAEAVVQVLRENKVPLLELEAGSGAGAAQAAPAWREAVQRERVERDELRASFDRVCSRLLDAGITPILFKSAAGLPYRSSNLDLLVRPGQMSEAARLLRIAGHLCFPHYREPHKLLFRKFEQGRSAICVHLHEAVSWGRVMVLPGDEVADRAVAAPGVPWKVAAREDLLLVTMAHSLYETDQIRLSDLRTLRTCAAAAGFDWDLAARRAEAGGGKTGFFAMLFLVDALQRALLLPTDVPPETLRRSRAVLAEARWAGRYAERMVRSLESGPPRAMPFPISKVYSKLHYVARLAGEPSRSPDERLVDLLATIGNLAANRLSLRCRPAVILSLSGLDGSGKSMAVRAVGEALELCEIPVKVVWSRGGFSSWMSAFKKAARSALPGAVPGPAQAEAKARWLTRPGAGAVFAALVVLEQGLHATLGVRLPRLLGKTVLCDRFAYDTAADLAAKLGTGPLASAASALVVAMAPRPDLAILLEVSPSTAERRKPGEASRGRLEAQAAALEDLARRHGLVVISAERSEMEVVGEAVERCLRAAFARFEGGGRLGLRPAAREGGDRA